MGRTAGYPKALTKSVSKTILQEVADAKVKLEHGKQFRRATREQIWQQSERQYAGDHFQANVDDGNDHVIVNMSFSTVNTIVPYMTGSDPEFLVEPFSGDATVRNAAIQAALLNRTWRSAKVRAQDEMETIAVDFIIIGDGYGKAGYTIAEQRVANDAYEDVASLWVERVSPWDIWIDPTADGIHNARWVVQRLRITRAELEADKAYKNTHEGNVSYGVQVESDSDRADNRAFRQEVFDGSEFATLYEFHDLVKKTTIVFSDGDLPLKYVEDVGECPIVQMGNYRIPGSPYHMGELEQIFPLQMELNFARSQMATHRRRGAQKYAYRKNALSEDALKALTSSTVNAAVEVEDERNLQDVIQPIQVSNLSGDVYNVSAIMQEDIYEISGINEYLRGGSPTIRKTATEASIIEGASNIKSQFKLRQIEKAARRLGQLLLGFAKDVFPQTKFEETTLFLTGREAERVAVRDDETDFGALGLDPRAVREARVEPTADIWIGEYEVSVTQSSTELRNPVIREQKYKGIFNEMVAAFPTLQAAGVIPNFKRILELWFEAAGVDDIDAMFAEAPAPPPLEADPEADAAGGLLGQLPGLPGEPQIPDFVDENNSGTFGPE